MYAVIGATGNVGYSTAAALCAAGKPVRAILRNTPTNASLRQLGCEIVLADLQNADALAAALRGVDAVHVIIPLSPTASDPADALRRSISSVIDALARAKPAQILAVSDYGAHVPEDIGMPSIFRAFEAQLRALGGQKLILRSAEHMHNWARGIPAALESGVLTTFEDPISKVQPQISAQDLGRIAAELLLQPPSGKALEIIHAEGPRRYSAADVATSLADLSGKPIKAQAVPRDAWNDAFARMPSSLADLLIKANDAKNEGGLVDVEPNAGEVRHGTTEMIDALRPFLPS